MRLASQFEAFTGCRGSGHTWAQSRTGRQRVRRWTPPWRCSRARARPRSPSRSAGPAPRPRSARPRATRPRRGTADPWGLPQAPARTTRPRRGTAGRRGLPRRLLAGVTCSRCVYRWYVASLQAPVFSVAGWKCKAGTRDLPLPQWVPHTDLQQCMQATFSPAARQNTLWAILIIRDWCTKLQCMTVSAQVRSYLVCELGGIARVQSFQPP